MNEARTIRHGLCDDSQRSDGVGEREDELMLVVRWRVQVDRAVRHYEHVCSPEWVSPFKAPGGLPE